MTNTIKVLINKSLAPVLHLVEEFAEESKSQASAAYQKQLAAAKTMGGLMAEKT